jgi:hypothetical protein
LRPQTNGRHWQVCAKENLRSFTVKDCLSL